jgi:hypothetical protein
MKRLERLRHQSLMISNPVIWQSGQDYRMADALHAARAQPTRARLGPERTGPER